MEDIKVKNLTLDQYRKIKGIKVIPDVQKAIHIPTYYRIIGGKNKYSAQDRSINKLLKLFGIDKETFSILIENQIKEKQIKE